MSDYYSTPSRSDSYEYSAFNTSAIRPSPGPDHLDLTSSSGANMLTFGEEPFENHHSPPSQVAHPKLSALFVDQVAQQYHITDSSQLERLHVFFGSGNALAGSLSPADLGTRIQMLAAIFSAQNQVIEALPSLFNSRMGLDFKSLFKDLETRLQDSFKFTAEQSLNIRRVAQEMICQPMRTAFKKMHVDIEVKMRRHPDKHQLGNIIGTPSRETLFTAKVKAISSQVRNTFRLDLWKSLSPGRSVPLSKFTVQQNLKNRPGALIGQENEQGYIIHYALLRRFALDNPNLKPTLSELSSPDSEHEGSSDVDGDEESLEPGRKRRRNAQDVSSQAQGKGGRVPNGKDFWSKVDNWFKDEIKKRGNDLTGARWKLYIDETLKQDNARFDSSVFSGPGNTPSSVVPGPSLPHSSEPLGSIVSSHSDAAGLTVRSDVFGHHNNLVEGIQSTSSTRDDGISAPQPSSSSLASLLRSAGV